jgi:hypothetical protein
MHSAKKVNKEVRPSGVRQTPNGLVSSKAVTEAMAVPAAAPLALFHLGLVSELVHRQWAGGRQQRQRQRQQQGLMHVHKELLAGLGMPALAAAPQPAVQYQGLDKLHVLNALQAAYQATLMRSQMASLAAHCAAQGLRVGQLADDSIKKPSPSGIPAGLHGTVALLVLGLLTLCAPYQGFNEVRVLTTGLKMLQLVLTDAALLQHTQHSLAGTNSGSTASASSSTSTASSSSSAAAGAPSLEGLAGAVVGPLVTRVGRMCIKGEDEHHMIPQLFPPNPWQDFFAAEEGGELLPVFGGLLRDTLLVMSPAGVLHCERMGASPHSNIACLLILGIREACVWVRRWGRVWWQQHVSFLSAARSVYHHHWLGNSLMQ